MNRTLVILGCLAVAMLVANVNASASSSLSASGSSGSASGSSVSGSASGSSVSSSASSSAPVRPSPPTAPTAPIRPNAPAVPFAPVQPAPSAVLDTRVIETPAGIFAVVVLIINSIDNQAVDAASFGQTECLSQCATVKDAFTGVTGVRRENIIIVSVTNAATKFQTESVSVTVRLLVATPQDALLAVRQIEANLVDGVLVTGSSRIAAVVTNSPATPATPTTPGTPTTPTLSGAILDVEVILGTTSSSFDSAAYRTAIAQLMVLPNNTYVQIIGTPADTIRSSKFSTSQNALVVNTRIQDPSQTTAQGVYNKFIAALATTTPPNRIAGVAVLGTPRALNTTPASAALSRPSLVVGFVALLAALVAFL